MRIGENGLSLIKHYEGCKLKSYLCPAGVWTIGYGHTGMVMKGMEITQEQAVDMLKGDIARFESNINSLKLDLSQHQFDALVCIIFNIGFGNFKTSTLLKRVASCDTPENIKEAFMMWVKAKGITLSGLVKRRTSEAELFNTGKVILK